MSNPKLPEPWLRGTLTDVPPVQRAVLHAMELAKDDLERWCWDLSDEELNTYPNHLAAVAFHLRHIARSIDRLLTYAEGNGLSAEQIALMKGELDPGASHEAAFAERSPYTSFFLRVSSPTKNGRPPTDANHRSRTSCACRRSHTTSRRPSHHHGKISKKLPPQSS